MALVCSDIVIPNLDVFPGNLEPSRLRCSILLFLDFSLVISFFLRYKWILWIAASNAQRVPQLVRENPETP